MFGSFVKLNMTLGAVAPDYLEITTKKWEYTPVEWGYENHKKVKIFMTLIQVNWSTYEKIEIYPYKMVLYKMQDF